MHGRVSGARAAHALHPLPNYHFCRSLIPPSLQHPQGIAEQEGTRKRSEGDANAKVELARAEKISLDTIAESIEADGCGQTEFMISKRCVGRGARACGRVSFGIAAAPRL